MCEARSQGGVGGMLPREYLGVLKWFVQLPNSKVTVVPLGISMRAR